MNGMARCLPVVQHGANDGDAAVLQRGDEGLQGGGGRHVFAGDDDGAAGAGGNGLAVRGFGAGRGVDDHDVVLAGDGGHERVEDGAGEQFLRVGRGGAGGQDG